MDKEKIKKYFDDRAQEKRVGRHTRYYHEHVNRLVASRVPANARVLEVGIGAFPAVGSVRPSRGVGIDLSPEMVLRAKKKYPQFEFYVMDADDIRLNEKFDYIIISDVVGFLPDVQHAFQELKKVSHPQTKVIVTYYNYLWEPILKLAEFLRLKRPSPIQNWLTAHDKANFLYLGDFEVITRGYELLMPAHVPLLSLFVNRYIARLPLVRKLGLVQYVVARPLPGERKEYAVSVVIPARNERGNIEDAVNRMPMLGKHTEIIFVEGHSSDGTREEIERVRGAYPEKDIKLFIQDGKGKGDAVRKGFANASGEVLMILDADLTVRPEDLPKFYEAIASGKAEFVSGSRLIYPLEGQAMRFLNLVGNKFFSVAFSWLLDQRIKDTLCGTKVLFKKDYERIAAGRAHFGDFDPFGDFDLLFGASCLNLKIVELPIRYQARVYGTTNISRWSHGWLLLKMVFFAMKKIKFT
ncbi:glycosyltransferase [Patescibacteria group bacterium]|nr:glycosyltransferase [Patescibacteria group bacterium]